jgi:mRNA (guanine-N7-)-methyltransferase
VDGLALEILYASAASYGLAMTRASNDTDPMGSPATKAPESAAARPRAEEVTEPDPQPPLKGDMTDEDQGVRSLLQGLDLSRAPAPVEAPTTNGDLSASYAAAGHAPARRYETPTPQPSILVREPTLRMGLPPAVGPTGSQQPATSEANEAIRAQRNAPTVRLDRAPAVAEDVRQPRKRVAAIALWAVPTTVVSLAAVLVIAFELTKTEPATSAPPTAASVSAPIPPARTTGTAVAAPSPPPAPTTVPAPAATPAASSNPTTDTIPPAASSTKRTPQAPPPSRSPTQHKPTRSTTNLVDDEP